jgi:uncharacterized protein (UPF0335 family)
VEGYSSRLEHVEDRISELEGKIKNKEKNLTNSKSYNSRAMKRICKNSLTP